MKVSATQTISVDISADEQRRITIETIREAAKWVDGNYISDGKLMLRQHYHSSHAWYEDLVVRDATELDLAVHVVISKLLNKP